MSPLCTPRYQEAASRRAGNLRSGPPWAAHESWPYSWLQRDRCGLCKQLQGESTTVATAVMGRSVVALLWRLEIESVVAVAKRRHLLISMCHASLVSVHHHPSVAAASANNSSE